MTGQGSSAAYQASRVEPALIPEGGRPLSEMVIAATYQCDRDEIRRLCLRAEAGIAPVGVFALTDEQLEDRRNRLHVLLAAVNDELERRGRTRTQRQNAERKAWSEAQQDRIRPLDASDSYPFP